MVTNTNTSNEVLNDIDWISNSFLLAQPKTAHKSEIETWRRYSDADFAFVGPGVGQNTVLNPAPGFTPLADIPRRGIWSGSSPPSISMSKGSYIKHAARAKLFTGVGRTWFEAVDSNKQTVNLRFGTAIYKGLFTFFTSFYDNDSANLARYGRVSISYYAGLALGTLATLPLAPLIMAGRVWSWLIDRTSSRYIDMKPAMPLFRTRMQVIYNSLGANLGIIARTIQNTGHYGKGIDTPKGLEGGTGAYASYMSTLLPHVFDKEGKVNVFSLMTSGARREIEHAKVISKQMEMASSPQDLRRRLLAMANTPTLATPPSIGLEKYLLSYHQSVLGDIGQLSKETDEVETETSKALDEVASGDLTALDRLQGLNGRGGNSETGIPVEGDVGSTGVVDSGALTDLVVADITGQDTRAPLVATQDVPPMIGEVGPTGAAAGPSVPDSPATATSTKGIKSRDNFLTISSESVDDSGASVVDVIKGWFADAGDHYMVDSQQGAAFLNLAVEYVGSGTMSLSNTLKETTISGTANSISSAARDTRISLSDYNTGFGFIDGALGMVRNLVAGGLDRIQMSGLMALAGNAFIDFPKQWDTSSVSLPTATFKIQLKNFSGNPLAGYLHTYPTIAALLAATLPPSTGPQSYTSPFLCECFCRGLVNIRMGMITDLSITAGTGGVGYDENWRPIDFEITFTVTSLSEVMHATISNGFNPLKPWRRVFDDDNLFNDYMSSITGMSTRDMVDPARKLGIAWAARLQDYRAFMSPEYFASKLADTGTVRTMNKIFGGVAYPGT